METEKEFINTIDKIIDRDLGKLAQEINLYPDDARLWVIRSEIKNSAGNLCMHLCGNLQHFFGAVLGKTSYIRNRDREFDVKGLSKADLLSEIEQARKAVATSLQNLDPAVLNKEYPIAVYDYPMTTLYFFVHLTAHLEYHLGQINYHRRLTVNP